jgi:molybdopterin/thiamine biosynthesis adenylyltransferase
MTSRELNDEELLRYSRHILLDDIGIEGQRRIANSKVLIVGAGGLGCPAALYLACAGVGTLVIADHDVVDLTNLQRQILHTTERVGQPKVLSAQQQIRALNPNIRVETIARRLEGHSLEEQVQHADLVLDCCDNFTTRYTINQACVKFKKPLVSGAAVRLEGQLACFQLNKPNAPCYHCLFPDGEEVQETRCATMGVLAPLTGVIGSLQAAEALKILAEFGVPLFDTLQTYHANTGLFSRMRFQKDPECPVCQPAKASN